MRRRIINIILLAIVGVNILNGQKCDCPYPIIFVHGINSNNETWDPVKQILMEIYDYPQILSFNLNSDYNSNNYVDDVTWVGVATVNDKCMYIINFDNSPDLFDQSASNESAIVKQGYALKMAIDLIVETTGKSKVILIGHSMGGLASRDYIQRWANPSNPKVAKLLTLGTPHLGANIAQNSIGLGVNPVSEASRDLAESIRIETSPGNYSVVPGYYLFGGDESETQFTNLIYATEPFLNQDVNCNGVLNEEIIGINSGTSYNPNMPLPLSIKYTYYISNVLGHDPLFPSYGVGGDGVVDDMAMWLYQGGSGSTNSFLNEQSIPQPNLIGLNYVASDVIVSQSKIKVFGAPLPYGYSHIQQAGDFNNIISGMDEGDFPPYAFNVEKSKWYIGLTQKRATKVANNSNKNLGKGTSSNETDSDWFKINLTSPLNEGRLILIRDNYASAVSIDIFEDDINQYSNNLTPLLSRNDKIEGLKVVGLDLGNLTSGTYYIRITQNIKDEIEDNHHKYSFIIADQSDVSSITADLRYDGVKQMNVLKSEGRYYLADIYNSVYAFDLNNSDEYDKAELISLPTNYWTNETIDEIGSDAYWAGQKIKEYVNVTLPATLNVNLNYSDSIIIFTNTLFPKKEEENSTEEKVNAGAQYQFQSIGITKGDGTKKAPGSIDAIGHEFFHLIHTKDNKINEDFDDKDINTFINLETNGIREGFCDIFGLYMEYKLGDNNLVQNKIYQLGKDFNIIKDFINPNMHDKLAKKYYHVPLVQNSHSVGMILNHLFYLISEGGKGTYEGRSFNFSGISIDTAFKIFMKNYELKLTNNSKFVDTYNGMLEVVTDLFGYCSPEYNCVKNAWYAIGFGDASVMAATISTVPSSCTVNTGQASITLADNSTPTNVFWDNGNTGLSASNLSPGEHTVQIINNEGCQANYEFEIEIDLSFISKLSKSPLTNCNSPNGSASLSIKDKITNSTPSNLSIKWYDVNNNIILQNSVSISSLTIGEYHVEITDETTGCTQDIPFTIELKNTKIGISGGGFRPICTQNPPQTLSLRANAINCESCEVTSWTTVDGEIINISSDELTIDVPLSNATYKLIMEDDEGCVFESSTNLSISYKDCSDCSEDNLSFISFTGVDPCKVFTLNVQQPVDPNEIIAPEGYSDTRWINKKDPVPYTILFENDPEFANAEATKVVIEHDFDVDIDPSSFRVGNFNFANLNFEVEEGKSFYQKRLDVRDSLGVYVDATIGVNIQENKAFWIFEAIDPLTGLPPADPSLGMLPINDTITRRGEGAVQFKVKPKRVSETYDTIFAKASIVFDNNPAIITNTEFNTIDDDSPITIMTDLPLYVDSTSVLINWNTAFDIGSGINTYSLFVSENGSDLELYKANLIDTFTWFKGVKGNTYCFSIKAKDNVGNIESKSIIDDCIILGSQIKVNINIMLQGPYVAGTNLMHDKLRQNNLIPKSSPYTNRDKYVLGNSRDTISNNVLDTLGPNAIVDWVYIELIDTSIFQKKIDGKPLLLQRDGDLMEIGGSTTIVFDNVPVGAYRIAVYHRNHIPIVTSNIASITPHILFDADLSQQPSLIYESLNAVRNIGGKYTLIAGDANSNGQIQQTDLNLTLPKLGQAGYLQEDIDMNGEIQNTDMQLYILPNLGRGKQF